MFFFTDMNFAHDFNAVPNNIMYLKLIRRPKSISNLIKTDPHIGVIRNVKIMNGGTLRFYLSKILKSWKMLKTLSLDL